MGEEIQASGDTQERKTLEGRMKCMKNVSITVAVTAMLIAAAGLAAGVYGIMQFQELSKKMDVKPESSTTMKKKIEEEVDCVDSVETEGEEVTDCVKPVEKTEEDLLIADSDYVYIGEWGIKIRIPEGTFEKLAYTYADGDNDTSGVRFNAIVNGANIKDPKYFDVLDNPAGIGVVSRVSKDFTEEVHAAKIFEDDKYVYYYTGPQTAYSTSKAEQDIEVRSADKLKEVLTNKENYSKF